LLTKDYTVDSGVVDDATVRQMKIPRCGLSDSNTGHVSIRRHKRYVTWCTC